MIQLADAKAEVVAANNQENSYKSILKGTSVFGGVQAFQILVRLIQGKFVALLLGPSGMGASSMFASAADTLTRFSSLGLNLAFVKRVAEHKEDSATLPNILRVALALTRATALLGAAICALLSPWLSEVTFGDSSYAWQFLLMSVAVYFMVSAAGKLSLLQGMHAVKILARASLAGAVAGLVCGVPLYWLWGVKGIVPALIAITGASWAFNTYAVKRYCPSPAAKFEWKQSKGEVGEMLKAGVVLMSSTLINSACIYLLNIFVRMYGELTDVGLYNAANSLTGQYAGVVFTAMMLDYFPRLAAASGDSRKMVTIVNRQLEIVALIAAPMLTLLIACTPIVVKLLLSAQFESCTPLLRWMALGVLIKAISYPLGYITFAKNNRTTFFLLEGIVANFLFIATSIGGYLLWGLNGLGYAMVVENAVCVVIYIIVNRQLYSYRTTAAALRRSGAGIAFAMLTLGIVVANKSAAVTYAATAVIVLISIAWGVRELRLLLKKQN